MPSGDLSAVKIAILGETGDAESMSYLVKDLWDGPKEIERRRAAHPELDSRFINISAPFVNRGGSLLWNWIMQPLGLHRKDVALFSVLNCYPGKKPDGKLAYPTGPARPRAEAECATHWLQSLVEWNPTVSIVALHPSGVSGDITSLPMAIRAVERAKKFAAAGERVLICMGGKAAKAWLGYGENTTRWNGHWQLETEFTRAAREQRRIKGLEVVVGKKEKKAKKLTVKTALAYLLENLGADIVIEGGQPVDNCYVVRQLTQPMLQEMRALLAPKKAA